MTVLQATKFSFAYLFMYVYACMYFVVVVVVVVLVILNKQLSGIMHPKIVLKSPPLAFILQN